MVHLHLPEFLEGKEISKCYECPFYDDGDGGYACHCNILDHYMNNPEEIWKEVRRKRGENWKVELMSIIFDDYCPMSHEEITK